MKIIIGVVATLIAGSALASDAMPVAQQNALVQKYCAVCHADAHQNGGLSLEHFDAAHLDPGVAAMMVSKIKGNAMGASGTPLPDRATQDALLNALSAAAVGANEWTLDRSPIITASIVKELPPTANKGEPDLYRLKVTCRADTHEGEMQLTWSPGVPVPGQVMSAAWDGQGPRKYKIDGIEKNGNGVGTSGPGAAVLYTTHESKASLPIKALTIHNLFPNKTVVFPFEELTQTARQALATCFTD